MTAAHQLARLTTLSTMPAANRSVWLESAEDAAAFLKANASADYVAVYASMPAVFIQAVLGPVDELTPPKKDELVNAYLGVSDTWCIQRASGGGEGHRIYLERPLEGTGASSLADGEPIVIRRDFPGMSGRAAPVELNQKIVHALALHWLPERKAFCELDDRGDLIDVIWVHELPGKTGWDATTVVLFEARRLSEYMAVSGQAMFRKFDFTRTAPESFQSWNGQVLGDYDSPDLFYNKGVLGGRASYIHGGQVIRPAFSVDDMVADWLAAESRPKEYETFKLLDLRDGSLVEVSVGPAGVRNYFTDADKPFETSPVFFRAEVLARFRANPDKYDVSERSISCRNAWYLKSYDLNAEGQVHTLACDLARLPIEEQRYWKLFNEWPKGFVSERSFKSDFLGQWTDPDALQSIKQTVAAWDDHSPKWWTPRGRELAERVLYPASGSAKEWGDDLLALDQLIIEGFVARELRALATRVGAKFESQWGSLKVLEAILVGSGMEAAHAEKVMEPLRTLNFHRNKIRGHAAPATRTKLEQAALETYGSFRAHFDSVATACDGSLDQISLTLASLESA